MLNETRSDNTDPLTDFDKRKKLEHIKFYTDQNTYIFKKTHIRFQRVNLLYNFFITVKKSRVK